MLSVNTTPNSNYQGSIKTANDENNVMNVPPSRIHSPKRVYAKQNSDISSPLSRIDANSALINSPKRDKNRRKVSESNDRMDLAPPCRVRERGLTLNSHTNAFCSAQKRAVEPAGVEPERPDLPQLSHEVRSS